jgi:hypothetical protein
MSTDTTERDFLTDSIAECLANIDWLAVSVKEAADPSNLTHLDDVQRAQLVGALNRQAESVRRELSGYRTRLDEYANLYGTLAVGRFASVADADTSAGPGRTGVVRYTW